MRAYSTDLKERLVRAVAAGTPPGARRGPVHPLLRRDPANWTSARTVARPLPAPRSTMEMDFRARQEILGRLLAAGVRLGQLNLRQYHHQRHLVDFLTIPGYERLP